MLSHPLPQTILVFDVHRDPVGADRYRAQVRDGVDRAFAEAVVRWNDGEYRGGLAVLPETVVLHRFVGDLANRLREHNGMYPSGARIHLGLCAHAAFPLVPGGDVAEADIILANRLLGSAESGKEGRFSAEPITLVVTGRIFRELVRNGQVTDPDEFREIGVRIDGARVGGWVRRTRGEPLDALTALVDALLEVPSVRGEGSRRLVLDLLPDPIGGMVRTHPVPRAHVFELVRTCHDYDDGMNALFRVLRELEGDSLPLRRAEVAAREWTGREGEIG